MTARLSLFGILGAIALAQPLPSAAQQPVSVELVMAVDTSASVNGAEFRLQMAGIATAFRAPEVIELIVGQDGVAVTLIQWAGWTGERHMVPWRLLTDRASVLAFAAEVESAEREELGHVTAIGSALETSIELIETNGYDGRLLKIDISGDGQSNAGLPLVRARLRAAARGITINGLAILTDKPDLDAYFREHVVIGPGAFVVTAADYRFVAEAMRVKLLRELNPPGTASLGEPQAASRPAAAAGSSRSTSASQ